MADVEKVIKEAEEELKWLAPDDKHRLHMGIMMKLGWIYDALELLKKQEAVEPRHGKNPDESAFDCGNCGYPLWEDELYCAHCGRQILWRGK